MTKRLNKKNIIIVEGVEHKVILNDDFSKCDECSLNYLCDDYSQDSDFSGCVPCGIFKDVLGDVYFRRKDE